MEGSGSASRRGRGGFHFRRELAEYEQGNRARVSARLSPLLVAAILVAAFAVPAPCSSSSPPCKDFEKLEDCDRGKCKCCAAGKGRCLEHGKRQRCNCTSPPEPPSRPSPIPSTGARPRPAAAPFPQPRRPPPPPASSSPSRPAAAASSAPSPHPGTRKLAVTTGWSFLCFALLLQVALGGFLVYRRWELQRLGLWQN